MSDGTVRGTFDLNTDPALNKLRSLRLEGGRVDETMRKLGDRMDTVATRTTAAWTSARKSVGDNATRIEGRVDVLEKRLEKFGRTRVSATIELNGWERVNAQLSELERRLDRLSRQRASPSVGIGGGFSNLAGGGGGGAGSAAGGGGGGFGLAGKLAVGGALLAPGIQALGVSSTALLGSASGAVLGAGAVGAGAVGVFGTGAGLTLAVAKPAIKAMQELEKVQHKYTQAVERYGAASKQAAVAREALNRADAKEPAAGVAVKQVGLFRSQFRRETTSGRRSIFNAVGNVATAGRHALPSISAATNRSASAVGGAASNFAGFLAEDQSQIALTQLTREFARDLPMVERSLQNLTSTAEHLSVAARPFFREGVVWTEHWTHSLATNTAGEARVTRTMHSLVEDTKDWGRLAGATFRTVRDIFNMGRPSGDSMVVSLTKTLDRWDAWIQRNPAKVERFFREAQTTTEKVGGALTGIVHLLSQAATSLSPIFNRATDLISLASHLGPTGTSAVSALALGGFRGGRGAMGGSGGNVLATAVMGRPMGFAGSSRVAGGSVLAGGGATTFLMPHSGGATGRAAVGGLGQLPLFTMLGGRTLVAGAGTAAAARVAASPEAFAARYGNIPGARYAAPVSTLEGSGGGLLKRVGGGALGGAAKTLGATLAIISALESAGKGGSPEQMLQNFGSGATFGLIHPVNPQGGRGAEYASRFLGGIPSSLSPMQQQAVIGRKIGRVLGTSFTDKTGIFTSDHFSAGSGVKPGSRGFMGEISSSLEVLESGSGGHGKNVVAEIKALRSAWKEAGQAAREYKRAREEALNAQSEQHGLRLGAQLGPAFGVETAHGASKTAAFADVSGGALASMRSMRETGRKVLGENTLAWARQLAKGNPELAGVVHQLTSKIKREFHELGQDVQIVNGHILTGSAEEWRNIATAMSEPLEKARERMSKAFTAIQQEAVGALVAMGFNRKGATAVIAGMEKGGPSPGQIAGKVTSGLGNLAGGISTGLGSGKANARGGVIGGQGLLDNVSVPGGKAAAGEAWIANRHTMNDLSKATIPMYGLTAWQMIQGESRPHSMPMRYSLGGASLERGGGAASLSGVHSGVRSVAEAILGQFPGLSVSSTTGGKHAKNSLHYLGEAVDLAGGSNTMLSAASWTGRNYGRSLEEGIHNPNLSIKHGSNVSPSYWGSQVWGEHANHIHVGVLGGGGARGAAGGGGIAHAIKLKQRRSGMGGVPGMLADAGISSVTKAIQSRINSNVSGGNLAGVSGKGGAPGANERLGREMMIASGWPSSEWPALKALWTQESGWNSNSVNASSGAYGIPQALGHGHPFNLGDARGQIAWGLNYIRGRYGSPSGAEAHERSFNWYSRGGQMPSWGGWNAAGGTFETRGPTLFGAGEHGKRERVSITPANGSNTGTGGGHSILVKIEKASFAAGDDIEKVAHEVAGKILDAIDDEANADRELIGR